MAMSRKLWSINGLAVELDRDRRVVADAVGHLKPDGESAGRPAWFMTTAIRALMAGNDGDGLLDPAQERARKDRALAIQTEMKNALARGEFVLIDNVILQVTNVLSVIRNRFLGLPAKACSRFRTDRRPELQALLHDEVCEILNALSDPGDLDAVKAARLRQSSAQMQEKHNGEHVGESTDGRGSRLRHSRPERGGEAHAPKGSSAAGLGRIKAARS